ncbi:alcohol-forming fatty acyl-CoA reductase [Trichonephila inaurata madagascariensis]|uniref:Fatty acyl-CoA reductase n=1 Tax=Trichonephila inaurata madagascariensis TaxID=2747483 RepID=A0A8X7CDE9_9ARAC|nr:alcohol-forming fatty acyl-CoA reductase [Trichonephila inaurata madagascariensis]
MDSCWRKRVVTLDEEEKILRDKELGEEFSNANNDDEGGNICQKRDHNICSQVILEILLRCFPGIQAIYILLRSKNGVGPQERKKEIFSRPLFNELKKINPSALEKVHVVAGDIALPNMGISEEDLLKVTENVTIVFHCAACISFFRPLRFIFLQNVAGVNNAIELCKKLKYCEVFVDTSTAYVNCNHDLILEERIYGIPYPAERFMEYFEKGEDEALERIHSEIQPEFPNHYVFCKCISENLIREKCSDISTVIARPALIAATWKGPLPGYAEEYSSLVQLILAMGKGFLKVLLAKPDVNLEIIPADIVANAHIVAAYGVANGRYSSPFVVNLVPYGLPILFSNMVPMLIKLIHKYPVPNAFRYTNHVWIVDSKLEKIFLSIFEHYIPAAGMDLMLILQGKKPKIFSLYRFLDKIMEVSAPFITRRVEFASENFRDLRNAVSPEKAEELYTELEGLKLKELLDNLNTGAPQYDWTKDKKTKDQRSKLIYR